MSKGDAARQRLIECAAGLLDRLGCDGMSISDVAGELGWSKSLFYYYCPTKQQLIRLAAQARADAKLSALISVTDDTGDTLGAYINAPGFWWDGDHERAARELITIYRPDNMAWRMYINTALIEAILDPTAEAIMLRTNLGTDEAMDVARAVLTAVGELAETVAAQLMTGASDAAQRAAESIALRRRTLSRMTGMADIPLGPTDNTFLMKTASEAARLAALGAGYASN